MKKILVNLIIILISLIIISCSHEDNISKKNVRPVKTFLIKNEESTAIRVFPGVTLASNETTLAFQIPGQIIKLPVLEGDSVNKGAILAELEPLKYQEQVNEAEAKLIRDKSNFQRASELVKVKHLSIADYDKVKSAYLIAQANYNTAKDDLNNTKLISPFTGVIAKKTVKNYEYVTAKQPILLLQDTATIDIEIHVPENIIVSLKKHRVDQEKIFANFDSIPNQTFNIKLKEYSSQADSQTQTFKVVFTMQRPENFNLLPGMTVSVRAALGNIKDDNFYIVPASAVFQDDSNHTFVWLINKKNMQVKKTPVKVSTLSEDKIRIVMGIHSGDLIVTSGVHFLEEGQEIKILK
jgi:RND family efflux transporter MFP subunit